MSHVRHYYHIVLTPKHRYPYFSKEIRRSVYGLLYGQLLKIGASVHRINGTDDHIHILVTIPAKCAVAETIKIMKQETSKEIVRRNLVPFWQGWSEGYCSFTCSYRELEMIKNYIKNQEEHHKRVNFKDEFRLWLADNGITPDDPFFPNWLKNETEKMNCEMIVAVGRNGEIGCENRLLWPLKEDLRHFKALTLGRTAIMGRRTWESLPKRPLPGRRNIVVTTNPHYEAPGAETAPGLAEALELASNPTPELAGSGIPGNPNPERSATTTPASPASTQPPMIIGGASLYAAAMPLATRLHLTRVEAEAPQADTHFPEIDPAEWRLESQSEEMHGESNGIPLTFRFETLVRQ